MRHPATFKTMPITANYYYIILVLRICMIYFNKDSLMNRGVLFSIFLFLYYLKPTTVIFCLRWEEGVGRSEQHYRQENAHYFLIHWMLKTFPRLFPVSSLHLSEPMVDAIRANPWKCPLPWTENNRYTSLHSYQKYRQNSSSYKYIYIYTRTKVMHIQV